MYRPLTTNRFDQDLKRTLKRGKDLEKIRSVMASLTAGEMLAPKHKDHSLVGNYAKRSECQVRS